MKTKIRILVLALSISSFTVQAQRMETNVRATSYDISDNLDLDAVASIFGDSENLEDFERSLNDPDNRISNLDLNEDGYIDYLRVIENSSDRNSLVVIQAVLDEDVYQDVATIEIERVQNGNPRIQIVGDAYIYGPDYIIEPAYIGNPLIFSFFWGSRYSTWHSPYYWNYYPKWYRYYRPYSPFKYRRHIYAHINIGNKYHRANNRNIHFSGDNYNHIRRNDYATRYPNRAFENRNEGFKNRKELNERRPNNQDSRQRNNDVQRSKDQQYQYNRPSNSDRNNRQRSGYEGRHPASTNQSGSPQIRTRENSNVRSNSNNVRIQPNSESGNRTNSRPSVSRSQSTSKPVSVRTQNRVEPSRKSSVSTEKSATRSTRERSNNQVRSNSKNEKKSDSVKKESRERRRTE
ncbi:MAG: hypothetical protein Q8N05_14130 [Bacteroidota bacterium]|nr:hypothetical protein [Bacteroidota bacterium]